MILPSPSSCSINRHNTAKSVLLPDPLLPQIPTLDPGLTSKVTPDKAGGRSGRYRADAFEKEMAPRESQSESRAISEGELESCGGRSMYS